MVGAGLEGDPGRSAAHVDARGFSGSQGHNLGVGATWGLGMAGCQLPSQRLSHQDAADLRIGA